MNTSINKSLVITAFAALCLGFAIAWVLKPSQTNEHMHSHKTKEGAEEVWTCSMHPQIRQSDPGLCPICEMNLVQMESKTSSNPLQLEMSPSAVKLAQIETLQIGLGTTSGKNLRLSGKIQADERLLASQVAHVPGRIDKLYVTFTGEQIRKGQKLAEIYSPELLTAQEELLQAMKFAQQNPELLIAARKKLEYWKITPEQIERLEKSKKVQVNFTLYADASGIVTNRKVSLGDHVDQGDLLYELQSLRKLWVLFDAYEEDLAHIKRGDRVRFTTPALPGESFETQINFIDPLINPNTRAASLRGEITNYQGRLKPEMFVKGMLTSAKKGEEQLMIPKSAVLWTGKRSIVYVKVPGRSIPTYEYREVSLGDRIKDQYIIEKGLVSGDEVVSQGSFSIDAAAQLNNQASMMNQWLEPPVPDAAPGIPDYRLSVPAEFVGQLQRLTQVYLNIKDALVATDSLNSRKEVREFLETLKVIDMSLLAGDAHKFWMKQYEALAEHAQRISKESDVEKQRTQFSFLSTALIQSLQAFGYTETLYVQHCPMALENTGANWLSLQKEIRNPYFGDKMLKCGSVEGILSTENIKQ